MYIYIYVYSSVYNASYTAGVGCMVWKTFPQRRRCLSMVIWRRWLFPMWQHLQHSFLWSQSTCSVWFCLGRTRGLARSGRDTGFCVDPWCTDESRGPPSIFLDTHTHHRGTYVKSIKSIKFYKRKKRVYIYLYITYIKWTSILYVYVDIYFDMFILLSECMPLWFSCLINIAFHVKRSTGTAPIPGPWSLALLVLLRNLTGDAFGEAGAHHAHHMGFYVRI